ncbi:MAG: hypothetical protein ACI9CF_000400 [Candidatus Omnitrophota bacterium]|jgi:hypothetical protein
MRTQNVEPNLEQVIIPDAYQPRSRPRVYSSHCFWFRPIHSLKTCNSNDKSSLKRRREVTRRLGSLR